jgi:hypothetical protein
VVPRACLEHSAVEKDLMPLPRIKPRFLGHSAHGLVTVLTGLSWVLLKINCYYFKCNCKETWLVNLTCCARVSVTDKK